MLLTAERQSPVRFRIQRPRGVVVSEMCGVYGQSEALLRYLYSCPQRGSGACDTTMSAIYPNPSIWRP